MDFWSSFFFWCVGEGGKLSCGGLVWASRAWRLVWMVVEGRRLVAGCLWP